MSASMVMRRCGQFLAVGLILSCLGVSAVAEEIRSETIWVPFSEPGIRLAALVCRPMGDQPRPAIIIHHGSAGRLDARESIRIGSCGETARWFTDRGLVAVFPIRRGYGETGGEWVESSGPCSDPDFYGAGMTAAQDAAAAVRYVRTLPYVRADRIIVAGHSGGGWGTLAMGGMNLDGVVALINFSGGRGGRFNQTPRTPCPEQRLADAARRFASGTRAPSLWIYAENDGNFGGWLARLLYQSYMAGGGQAEFHMTPAFGDDGHALFGDPAGIPVWGPMVEAFLRGRI